MLSCQAGDYLQDADFVERCEGRCVLGGLFGKGLCWKQQGMENGQAATCLCKSFPRLLSAFPPLPTTPSHVAFMEGLGFGTGLSAGFYFTRKVWAEEAARSIGSSGQEASS